MIGVASDPRLLARFLPEPVRVLVVVIDEARWGHCVRCGGQGREWAIGSEGGWYWRPCSDCLGVGSVLR